MALSDPARKRAQGDVGRAADMLLSHLRWRREVGADELLHSFSYPELPEVLRCYPQNYHKTDFAGRPVWIERLGRLQVGPLMRATTFARFLTYHVWQYERCVRTRMPAAAAAAGALVEQSVFGALIFFFCFCFF